MKIGRVQRGTFALAAIGLLLSACGRSFNGFAPVERGGFRLQITSVATSTKVRARDGSIHRGVLIRAKTEDVAGQRIATVEHSLILTEVRDQYGRDLLELASAAPPASEHNDTPTHPMFLTPESIELGRGFTYWPTAQLSGLPHTPRKLRKLSGYARLLVATSMISREFAALPTEGDRIVPGYWVQITRVQEQPGRVLLAYRTRTQNIEEGYDETLPPFLYLVELLDEEGELIERYNGAPTVQNTATGTGQEDRAVVLDPPDRKLKTIRFTVIEEIHYLDVPFSYANIPLK